MPTAVTAVAPRPSAPYSEQALPGASRALLLLLAINLFNYIDRQVLAAVEPEIQKDLLPGVAEEHAGFLMGMLSTAFLVMYMVSAPLFGWLAERMARWKIVAIGVAVWSVASGASGMNWHLSNMGLAFWLLLCTRLFVGVGEGAYGPVAPTMLADLYPVARRGRIMAYFYLAIPVGGALGYAWGEVFKDLLGWHWAFYLVAPPGLLLAALCLLMPEPPRGRADAVQTTERKPTWGDYGYLLRIPSFALNTAGMTLMSFGLGGLAYWMPAYLTQVGAPPLSLGFFELGPRTTFGAVTALAGLIATLLGGLAGDWLRGRVPGAYFFVSGVGLIFSMPMLLLFLNTPFPLAWVFGFLTVFGVFFSTGPTATALANVMHPSLRAAGFALNILIIHLLGDAISPPVLGWVAGRVGQPGQPDYGFAFVIVSVTMAVGGVAWLWGMRCLEFDTRLAPSRLPES